jgi:hypothetical protein
MDSSDINIHSFIVKIWLEETVDEAGRATWRGHITHVLSGERRYIKDLEDTMIFLMPYLQGMGVKVKMSWRINIWLKRIRTFVGRALSSI